MKKQFVVGPLLLFMKFLPAQQQPDTAFSYRIPPELYDPAGRTTVYIDAAHNNLHTAAGGYLPFAHLLRSAGYEVRSMDHRRVPEGSNSVYVIVNALHRHNLSQWSLPVASAFSNSEVRAIERWVRAGGRLFLIADHMPFGGAAANLASVFGFTFTNSFAIDSCGRPAEIFRAQEGTLVSNTITQDIPYIQGFCGQAFLTPPQAGELLRIDSCYRVLMPATAWDFDRNCKTARPDSHSMLAVMVHGKGRVVMSGEAGMFTAQLAGGQRYGMNSPGSEYNALLALRLLSWLAE